MLGARQRRRLARRSGDDQAVGALLNMKVDQSLETRVIDPIVIIERRYERDQTALEHK